MTDGDADVDSRETDEKRRGSDGGNGDVDGENGDVDGENGDADEGTVGADGENGEAEGEVGGTDGEDGVTRESDSDVGDAVTGPTRAENYTTGRRSISGRIRLIWGLRVAAFALVLGGIGTAVARGTQRVPLEAGPVLAVVILFLGIPWVHLRYRVWAFELRDDALYLERGVLTHVKSIVPFVRIQHVDTQRGPVERALGLSTLVVYTAGSRGADVSIPGLTPEEARDLQRRVKELAIEAEGGDAV